ncbi:MAG: dTMP kinase [Verrucomicrobia bacterium]|nr:dTMP kinase [Verrucomicrobiota bacterium]
MSHPGRFITLEGGEAAGKSTQIARLAERLRRQGRSVLELREPGGTPLGEKIRHLLKHDPDGRSMSAETELLLMNASRAELVQQRILPALRSGQIVLCDRFYDSTVAYQGFGRGLDLAAVQSVIQLAVGGLRPDRTLWLDVAPEIARTRLAGRQAAQATSEPSDRFDEEQEAFFARVAQGFREAFHAEPDRWRHVDAGGLLECVEEAVWSAVSDLFQETASVG